MAVAPDFNPSLWGRGFPPTGLAIAALFLLPYRAARLIGLLTLTTAWAP